MTVENEPLTNQKSNEPNLPTEGEVSESQVAEHTAEHAAEQATELEASDAVSDGIETSDSVEVEESAGAEETAADDAVADEPAASDASAVAARAVAAARKKRGRGAKKKQGGMTAGQRLAAQKDKKAAEKQAAKQAEEGTEAEVIEDAAEEIAQEATSWFMENGKTLAMVAAAIVALGFGAVLFSTVSSSKGAEATAALNEALDFAGETETSDTPAFGEAAKKFASVATTYQGKAIGDWALLAEAQHLMKAGDVAAAKPKFKSLSSAKSGHIAASAHEALGFIAESEGDMKAAESSFASMAKVNGPKREHAIRSEYQIARLKLADGKSDEALTKFKAVQEKLNAEDAPELPYVRRMTESNLRGLGETVQPRLGGGMPSIPPELLRQLQGK